MVLDKRYLRTRSSEIRGLHSTKCSSKMFQFNIYYILCIRKATFIHKGKSKVAQDEKQNDFSLEHFIKHNILYLKSIIPQALQCKYGLLSEYLNFLHQKIRISFFINQMNDIISESWVKSMSVIHLTKCLLERHTIETLYSYKIKANA